MIINSYIIYIIALTIEDTRRLIYTLNFLFILYLFATIYCDEKALSYFTIINYSKYAREADIIYSEIVSIVLLIFAFLIFYMNVKL